MSKNISNPFTGLKPYSENNSDVFFGREQEVENMLDILQKNKLLTVSGVEGSGKTSIIKAGLISRLKNGFMGQAGKEWSIAYFRPGINPISNLAHALTSKELLYLNAKSKTTDYSYYKNLLIEFEALGIFHIYKNSEIFKKKNLLIVIDQLEDLFRFKKYFDADKSEDDNKLMDLIYRSVSNKNISIYFVIGIENRYMTRLTSYKKLQEIVNPSHYSIQKFDVSKINHLLKNTFTPYNIKFEQTVIDYFYKCLNKDSSYLPNFQFLLFKLYDKYCLKENKKRTINENDIKEFGELSHVISTDLDKFYNKFENVDKNNIALFFKTLIKPHESIILSDYQKIKNISEISNLSIENISLIINSFKDKFSDIFEVFEPSISEIKHLDNPIINSENILSLKYVKHLNWEKRNNWIEEEKKDYLQYKILFKNAIRYENNEVDFIKTIELDNAILWRDNKLHNINWSKKHDFDFKKTIDYINKSEVDSIRLQKERDYQLEREKKNEKAKKKAYFVFITVCLILTIVAFKKCKDARDSKEKIEKNNIILKNQKNELDDSYSKLESQKNELNDSYTKLESQKNELNDSYTKLQLQKKTINDKNTVLKYQKDNLDKKNSELEKYSKQIDSTYKKLKISQKKAIKESTKNKVIRELIELKYSFNDLHVDLNKAYEEKNISKISSLIKASIKKQKIFDSLKKSQDSLPYINDENILKLNQKTFSILENKNKYSKTSMLLAKTEKYSIRDFSVFNNELIAYGGDFGKLNIININTRKNVNTINISKNKIEDRIRKIQFLNKETLYVTTFSKKVLKFNSTSNEVEPIYGPTNSDIVDFYIDSINKKQLLVLKNEIRIHNNNHILVSVNTTYKNIKASFLKKSKLYFISDNKFVVLDIIKNKTTEIYKFNKIDKLGSIYSTNNLFFVGNDKGKVSCFEYNFTKKENSLSPKLIVEFIHHNSKITSLFYDENNKNLYTCSLDNKIYKYDFNLPYNEIKNRFIELVGHEKWIWHMDIYTDKENNKMLVTADEDGNLLSWFTNSEDLLKKIKLLIN